jgi:toxin secretion/phage lysis holin
MRYFEALTAIFAVGATSVTALMGGWDTALQVFLVFVVLDILTGVLKGLLEKDFSSKRARKGFVTKVGYLIAIIVATQFDKLIPADMPLVRTFAVWFYIGVEGSSIIENLAKMGVPIPQAIVDRLAVLKGKAGGEAKADDNGKFTASDDVQASGDSDQPVG